jgi:DNA invertase Pin-like site-specific DNA recombinase
LASEDQVDISSLVGKAFFQTISIFAEIERAMIPARTKAGIAKDKINRVKFGRILVLRIK